MIVSWAVVEPVTFDAVTVYVVWGDPVVGVPETAPVPESNVSPAGSVGFTENAVMVPVTVGVSVAMAVPTVASIVVCGYAKVDGAAAATEIFTVAVVDPAEFDAVTV